MLQAVWVHGNTARPEWVHDNLLQVRGATWDSNGAERDVPWSDVNGLPRGWGATFRGRRAFTGGLGGTTTGPFDPADPFRHSQKGYWFHFSLPTPVIVNGNRAALHKVFPLWSATGGARPWAVHVYDGVHRVAERAIDPNPPHPTGANGLADLVEGKSMFTLPPRHVFWSIGLSVAVAFESDGDVTFVSAGADFDA
jgi:hypothetical protein